MNDKILTKESFAAPKFAVDDGWYKEHKTEDGINGNAFVQLASQDPSPVDHVDHIYNKKLLELRVDPSERPGTARDIWNYAEKAATLERHLLSCPELRDAGGPMRAPVSKFLGTANSAALFPAFVESQISAGLLAEGIVDDVVMGTVEAGSNSAIIFEYRDTEIERDLARIAMGAELPMADITTGEGTLPLYKYGKAFKIPREVSALASIEVVTGLLNRVGKQIAISQSDWLMSTTIAGDGRGTALGGAETNALDTDVAVAGTIAYSDMLSWVFNAGKAYDLDIAIAGGTDLALIANLAEFKDPDVGRSPSRTQFKSPLGLRYVQWDGGVTNSSYVDRLVVGIDSRNGYRGYRWGPNITNTGQLIRSESDIHTFSYYWNVAKVDITATQVLDTNAAL